LFEENEADLPHRGILDRLKKSAMLRSFYGYTRVYIPFVAILVLLLGVVFVYKQVNPDVTLSQRWMTIAERWNQQRLDVMDALANDGLDNNFDGTVADYAKLKTILQGWVSDMGTSSDWGVASVDASLFIKDTTAYLGHVTTAANAATASDLATLTSVLSTDSQTFDTDAASLSLYLGLTANGQPTLAPGVTPSPSPSPPPSESASATASGSAAPSGSATASSSDSAAPSGSAASQSAGPSPTPSGS
jgi:hypothetical protein